ncbi:hypothetical protein B0I72DRAFT_86859 [Yarrowia lipolytica]|nr:hypothetical protein B0I72DRAFT_86859 [Yarrowia lipolytica]RDW39791.1 hypothetical protein B0I73DRAFT_82291 [Yarrowia lipolytica]
MTNPGAVAVCNAEIQPLIARVLDTAFHFDVETGSLVFHNHIHLINWVFIKSWVYLRDSLVVLNCTYRYFFFLLHISLT